MPGNNPLAQMPESGLGARVGDDILQHTNMVSRPIRHVRPMFYSPVKHVIGLMDLSGDRLLSTAVPPVHSPIDFIPSRGRFLGLLLSESGQEESGRVLLVDAAWTRCRKRRSTSIISMGR